MDIAVYQGEFAQIFQSIAPEKKFQKKTDNTEEGSKTH
jgi:hypothetical protein